jgi:hypothetical protein
LILAAIAMERIISASSIIFISSRAWKNEPVSCVLRPARKF